jgi:two-component system cell cycle response regulator
LIGLTEAALARILVVEDEVDTRMVLGKFLTVAGHEVLPAANGWEALLVLDTTPVDLILLDVMMPGMDGVTFLQILRQAKKHKHMPVVLVTALDVVDVERRTRQFDVSEILPKTQRLLDDLMKTVNRLVGHSAAAGAHPSGVSPQEN